MMILGGRRLVGIWEAWALASFCLRRRMYHPRKRKMERAREETLTAMATLDLVERGSGGGWRMGRMVDVAELVREKLMVEDGVVGTEAVIVVVDRGKLLLILVVGIELEIGTRIALVLELEVIPALTVTILEALEALTIELPPLTTSHAAPTFPTAIALSTWLHPSFKHAIAFPIIFPVPQWHAKSVSFAHPSVKTPFTKHVNAHIGSWRAAKSDWRFTSD